MIFLVLFLLLYGPRLKIIDVHIVSVVLVAIYGFWLLIRRRTFSSTMVLVGLWLLFLFAYALVVLLVSGNYDTSFLESLLKIVLYMTSCYGLFAIYERRYGDHSLRVLFRHIVIATFINALFVVVVIFSESFRSFSFELLAYPGREHWVVDGYRAFDLSMGGGAIASLVFSLVAALLLHERAQFSRFTFWVLIIVISAAVVFTGRSGVIFLCLAFLYFPFISMCSVVRHGFVSLNGMVYSLATFLFLGVLVGMAILTPAYLEGPLSQVLPWAFEFFYNNSNASGAASSVGSLETIVGEMYFLPDSLIHILFGDSNLGRTDFLPYVASDVGYVRVIFSHGIVGLVLLLAPIVTLFLVVLKSFKSCSVSKYFLFFVLCYLVFNFKELLIEHRSFSVLLFLLVFSVVFEVRQFPRAASCQPQNRSSCEAD